MRDAPGLLPRVDPRDEDDGLENDRYAFWPKTERPPIKWPNGARVALVVVPNIEHFRLDRPGAGSRARPGSPDVPSYAVRDYGNRVGIWNLFELLDKHGIKATALLNSDVCAFEPQVIQAGVERGWEWAGHGKTNSTYMSTLDEKKERSTIEEVARVIGEATGTPPRGWLGPAGAESIDTPDFLAAAGFTYVMDWTADEEPFPMRVKEGRLISMPYGLVGDLPLFIGQGWTGEQFYQHLVDYFDALYIEGERSGRVFTVSLHPWVIGRPPRLKWLDKALEHIKGHDRVWLATAGEVADWYFEHQYDEAIKRAPLPEPRAKEKRPMGFH